MIFFQETDCKNCQLENWRKNNPFLCYYIMDPFRNHFSYGRKNTHRCIAHSILWNKEMQNLDIFIIHESERNKEQEKLMKLLIIIAIFRKIIFQHKEHSEMKEYFMQDIIA